MDETVEDKPPPNKSNMGSSTGILFTPHFVARRFKVIGELWTSDWDICPTRSSLHSRCLFVPANFQEEIK